MPRTRRQTTEQDAVAPDTTMSVDTKSRSTRRSARQIKAEVAVAVAVAEKDEEEVAAIKQLKEYESEDDDEEEAVTQNVYVLDGEEYTNYQDFVAAKRKRNQKVLMNLGFGGSSSGENSKRLKMMATGTDGTNTGPSQRGLKSNKKKNAVNAPPVRSRKSSRISGDRTKFVALDMYVNDWHRDNTATIVTKKGEGGENENSDDDDDEEDQQQTFFNGRVNDGSALSLKDAIDLNEPKWIHDDSEGIAENLLKELTIDDPPDTKKMKRNAAKIKSPISVISSSWEAEIMDKVEALSIDKEEWVCKVIPDRIYSVATHPSESKLICCAGDKQGYVGLWDVDGVSSTPENDKSKINNNGVVSLFRVHSRPICCLEWLNSEHMVTASYDGSVRRLNAETGTFEEIFATYDDSDTTYIEDLGYGLDQGYRYWTQHVTTDHRYKGSSNPCLFVSTSVGDVFHVDLRVSEKQKITFHESVSEKKINTVSLHPNGTTLATSGNDGAVRLFDIRKFRDSRGSSSSKSPKPLCTQITGLSVSSSFFSPSGKSLLTTSFANRFDLTEGAHLIKSDATVKPTHSIPHNNKTGRWLTTFQATWHPEMDIFCSGSMDKPRRMEVFDAQGRLLRKVMGESLGSIMSRTCFHLSTDKLIMVGGNSSGRMVVIR